MNRLSRKDISQIYQQGEEAVIALVESFSDAIALLEARIAVLEGQQKKNSKNSSKPPSSDGLRRTVSLREPTGKKPGGQADHEGRTLERVAEPDEVIVHAAPEVCSHCQTRLADVAAEIAESRQVMDVPKVKMFTTEHQGERKQCPCCHHAEQGTLHQLKELRRQTENPAAVLSPEAFREIEHRYDELVEAALCVHPRTILRADGTTKGRIKQTEERLLLERLHDHKADILRFATDPCAAFDNNLAERDVRMIKVQQKISGSFRSMEGAKVFCRLRGFCSTVRKNAANILDALVDAFLGNNFVFSI